MSTATKRPLAEAQRDAAGKERQAAMMRRRYYYVETWNTDKQTWTPQNGVSRGPYSQFGLREALRKLGYTTRMNETSTLVWYEDRLPA